MKEKIQRINCIEVKESERRRVGKRKEMLLLLKCSSITALFRSTLEMDAGGDWCRMLYHFKGKIYTVASLNETPGATMMCKIRIT